MDISFFCRKCGQHLVIEEAGAGIACQCPNCGCDLIAPQSGSEKSLTPKTTPPVIAAKSNIPPIIQTKGVLASNDVIDARSIDEILAQANMLTLHEAVKRRDKLTVMLLITKGADVNARDNNGMTPFDLASVQGNSDMVELLVAKGAVRTTPQDRLSDQMFEAIVLGDNARVQSLIAQGADVRAKNISSDMTPLDWASILGKEDIAKLLAEKGAVLESTPEPLHNAVATGDMAAVEKLIVEGNDVNKKDLFYGMTALDWALILGKGEIAKLLIAKGGAKADWLKAQELVSDDLEGEGGVDRFISAEVRREVWRRDQGRCVECGSQEKLEYDHIIPVSKGGSNTARNIQLLCEKCNREKSADIR